MATKQNKRYQNTAIKSISFACSVIFLVILIASCVHAQDNGLIIRLNTSTIIAASPGRIITASFTIINNTGQDGDFIEQIILPDGWQQVIQNDPLITLKSGEPAIRIVVFSVPSDVLAGVNTVSYYLESRKDPSVSNLSLMYVNVLPVAKLELYIEDSPERIYSGVTYEADLKLVNRSNLKANVRILATEIFGSFADVSPKYATLEPGESTLIKVNVKINKYSKSPGQSTVIVSASTSMEAAASGEAYAERIIRVQIIQEKKLALPEFIRTVPAKLSIFGTGSLSPPSFQAEMSGAGKLDDAGKHRIDFLFRVNDLENVGSFGRPDQTIINYYNPLFTLRLGDRNFYRSRLLGGSIPGQGIGIAASLQNLTVSSYYVQKKDTSTNTREAGVTLGWTVNKQISLFGTVSKKNSEREEVYSVAGNYRPNSSVTLYLEAARSVDYLNNNGKGKGYKISFRNFFSEKYLLNIDKTYASPNFIENLKDFDQTDAAFSFPVNENIKANLAYKNYATNLLLDASKPVADRARTISGGLNISAPFNYTVNLSYADYVKLDALPPADYDYTQRTLSVGIGRNFGELNLSAGLDSSVVDDNLTDTRSYPVTYNFIAGFGKNLNQNYSLRFSSALSNQTGKTRTDYGATGKWQINDDSQYSINYDYITDNDNALTESIYATLRYGTFFDQVLTGSLRWNNDKQSGVSTQSFYFNYMMPISLPIWFNFGKPSSIKGKVINLNDDGRIPIPEAVLIVNNSIVKTNNNGEFNLGPIVAGEYSISVDNRSIGLDNISDQKTYIINVKEGRTATLEIGVVKACDIFGRIEISDEKVRKSHEGIAIVGSEINISGGGEALRTTFEAQGINGVVVGITKGKETYYQVTENNGNFYFRHVRPGKWVVTAYQEDMPQDYYLEQKDFEMDLKPGDEKIFIFKALPVIRSIKIIDTGQIKGKVDKIKTAHKVALKPPTSRIIYHVVAAGDTLMSISRKYFNGSASYYKKIAKTNGITDPRRLKVGMRLKIYKTH